MAKKVQVVLNRRNVSNQLLKGGWIQGICEAKAKEIAKRCGDGYEVDPFSGKNRVNVAVVARTAAAARDNKKNNTLLKGLGG